MLRFLRRQFKSYRRLIGGLVPLCVGAATLITIAAYAIYMAGQADHAAAADLIIVLGAGVYPDGTPNLAAYQRTMHGAALYKRGLAQYILCTGGYDTPQHVKSEAAVCRALLLAAAVPADAILIEEISTSTEENADQARRLMRVNGLKSAILVSDNYHLLRAAWMFRDRGISVVVSPAQATQGAIDLRWGVYGSYREVFALMWYALRRNFP